ncbi:MAG: thioredoxin [Phycisphaerales bacterium]|nr:thioredoxin [Phycisphaerales bacterium]
MTTQLTLEITSLTFDETIQSSTLTLIDFWAPWCGPCRALGPTIDKLAADLEGRAQIAKVNIDDHPDLAAKYGVSSIPTVIVFKDGEPTDKFVGIRPYSEYFNALENE